MSEDLQTQIKKLERENRILGKKLARSEEARVQMEESKDRFDTLYQNVIAESNNQKKLLQQIIDFLPDPTFVIDNNGVVISWNRAIEDLTGKKADRILGKGDYEYALPFYGERKEVLIDFVRLGKWNKESNEDYSLITEKEEGIFIAESYHPDLKGGAYLSSTARVLLDIADKPAGAIESIRDITARKLSEKELKQRLEELAKARRAMLNIMEDIETARKTTKEALEVISGSINYASHIQKAILPDNRLFSDAFSDYFIQWEPRDVVGGDIYWSIPRQDGLLLALGDCTGHGVPGAFMTLITTDALNRAESEMNELNLARLVQRMHQIVQESLGQHEKGGTSDDGIELGVCYFNAEMTELIYVGARFSLFLIESGEIIEFKGDKKAVGYRGIPRDTEYTEKRIKLQPGQKFYMTSDGLLDQIGGEKRRSFGKKRFKKLMVSLAEVPFSDHGTHIYKALIEYQGKESRRDDVAVFGFKI